MTLFAQAQLVAVLAEVVELATGLIGLYLAVATVTTLAQGHFQAITGQPGALAEVLNRFLPVVICAAVAVSARALGEDIAALVSASAATEVAAALALWRALAAFVVRAVILCAAAGLTAALVGGVAATQLAIAFGLPRAVASGWHRIGLILLTGVLTIAGLNVANAIGGALQR